MRIYYLCILIMKYTPIAIFIIYILYFLFMVNYNQIAIIELVNVQDYPFA